MDKSTLQIVIKARDEATKELQQTQKELKKISRELKNMKKAAATASRGTTSELKKVSTQANKTQGTIKKLIASDFDVGNSFGKSVSISGNTVLVGDSTDRVSTLFQAGSSYVFSKDEGGTDNWGQLIKLIAPDAEIADEYGFAASFSICSSLII